MDRFERMLRRGRRAAGRAGAARLDACHHATKASEAKLAYDPIRADGHALAAGRACRRSIAAWNTADDMEHEISRLSTGQDEICRQAWTYAKRAEDDCAVAQECWRMARRHAADANKEERAATGAASRSLLRRSK